ncbi:MAG: hypothetical protein OXM61_16615 [Candidatus Poribacteria bacterium]|nr:hypothetical protein [Candidatus Poribacteria bacterium]
MNEQETDNFNVGLPTVHYDRKQKTILLAFHLDSQEVADSETPFPKGVESIRYSMTLDDAKLVGNAILEAVELLESS